MYIINRTFVIDRFVHSFIHSFIHSVSLSVGGWVGGGLVVSVSLLFSKASQINITFAA